MAKKKEELFKDTYILALVHKLRTPLNGARWILETIMPNLNGEQKELLQQSYKKILESIDITSDILKTAVPDSNLSEAKNKRIDLCKVIDKILENLNFLVKESKVSVDYKKCDSAFISGDVNMLDIGLGNLFDNAFRYSPKGKVSITIEKDNKKAKLTIKDDGIGISNEDMEHLFEKFYRGANAKVIDPNPGGVGLFATKRIIEMHNGTIKYDSKLDEGTTVTVTFPLD